MNTHVSIRPGPNDDTVFVVGLGSYLPGKPVANEAIAQRLPKVPVLDLMRYFGVEQRHFVVDAETGAQIEEGLGTCEMACRAASAALADAGLTAGDIDLIVTTTATPDVIMPPLARQVQRRLGIERAQLFDLRGGCAAAIQGLILARTMIRSGLARAALICGAECMSPYYYAERLLVNASPDASDMINGLIFADGASAMVVVGSDLAQGRTCALEIGYCRAVATHPHEKEGLLIGPDERKRMPVHTTHNHKLISRLLPRIVGDAVAELVAGGGRRAEDYGTIVVPQANRSLMSMIMPDMVMGLDGLMFYVGDRTANIPGAAMVMALDFAVRSGRVTAGGQPVGVVAAETASWTYAVVDLVAVH
ncbi:3-oxoacyl-ACP synthase III family protein [Mesorhizobium sp. 1B3]|uniref:3-oxoacyl-ACP synthase III family protein n=1 Tax=Mesorhizobium sp. 1B3 TaxID=3243599 RepID=UPI003D97915D